MQTSICRALRREVTMWVSDIGQRMRVLVAVLYVSTVWGYRHFQDEIPNGESVPHPCKANYIWAGVGHLNPLGGGDINPFGVDFKNAGMKWTKSLCEMDSDGDGETNGEELGDPDCVWTKGNAPAVKLGLSHPGVCTPHSATACQAANAWIDCDIGGLECDVLNEVGLKNISVRIPEGVVPTDETNYSCMLFELPTDGDYHLVATEPDIDNVDIMHHILLFGCDDAGGAIDNFPMNTRQFCGMESLPGCTTMISGWGVGSPGECFHTDAAIRIGQNGYKKALMQVHWNNPGHRSDYTDSSGMRLYYTPHRRPNDAAMWMVGASYLEIPPGEEEVVVEGWCRNDCSSRYLAGPIYITKAQNHMHNLGRKQKIQQYRNGVWLRDITNEETYAYDRYVTFAFDPPIEVLPGDEIKTTCTYRSIGRDTTTFIGYSTAEEMCYGFLNIYPNANLLAGTCRSWKGVDLCKIKDFSSDFPLIDGCKLQTILNPFNPILVSLFNDLMKLCKPFDLCTQECKHYVAGVLASNKCFRGDIGTFYRVMTIDLAPYFKNFWAAIDSCKTEIEMDACQVQCDSAKNSGSVLKRG